MDADQINEMLTAEKLKQIENRKADPFLPGEGKFYCLVCDKHFIDANAYKTHERGGQHRLRLREVREGGFNPREALKSLGKATDNGRRLNRGVVHAQGEQQQPGGPPQGQQHVV